MHNKKSAIEVQFNWLFVLIIGGVILITFFGFAVKQRNVSDELSSSSVVNSLDAIITSAQSSAGAVSLVKVPKEEVTIECNRISIGTAGRQYENLILFSPNKLKSSTLITHTASLNIPYRVSNLLFVTSPDVRYILIGDFTQNFAKEINKSIPREVSKDTFYYPSSTAPKNDGDKVGDTNILNENHQKVRFVMIENDNFGSAVPTNFQSMNNEDVSKIVIKSNEKVIFHEKSGSSWGSGGEADYIKESFIGAIYSDDVGQYKCNMNNVFKRADKVTEVYKERAKKLSTESSAVCKGKYTNLDVTFDKIRSNNFPSDVNGIIIAGNSLKTVNGVLQSASCPLIY